MDQRAIARHVASICRSKLDSRCTDAEPWRERDFTVGESKATAVIEIMLPGLGELVVDSLDGELVEVDNAEIGGTRLA